MEKWKRLTKKKYARQKEKIMRIDERNDTFFTYRAKKRGQVKTKKRGIYVSVKSRKEK